MAVTQTVFPNLELSTEQATAYFGIIGGVSGAVAGVLASSRLSGVNDTVPLSRVLLGVLPWIGGAAIGAFLLPSA